MIEGLKIRAIQESVFKLAEAIDDLLDHGVAEDLESELETLRLALDRFDP